MEKANVKTKTKTKREETLENYDDEEMEEDGEYDDEDGEYDDEEEEEKSIVKTKPKVANPQKDIKNKDNVKSK